MALHAAKLDVILDPERLRIAMRSLALFDAILEPDWEHRYFSFNAKWDSDEQMASIRNGEGSEAFVLFAEAGVVAKSLDKHAVCADPAAALRAIPDDFRGFKAEPAFSVQTSTVFLWRPKGATTWSAAPKVDSIPFAAFLAEGWLAYYAAWAARYFERPVDAAVLGRLASRDVVAYTDVLSLNGDADRDAIQDDADEIGISLKD